MQRERKKLTKKENVVYTGVSYRQAFTQISEVIRLLLFSQ